MGYINDIVVAEAAELQRVADSPSPTKNWPGAQDIGLGGGFLLASLYCLLTGADDVGEAEDILSRQHAENSTDPTAYAFVIPEEMTSLLALLGSDRLDELSVAWAGSEEMMYQGRSLREARQMLATLRDLARQARSENKVLISFLTE